MLARTALINQLRAVLLEREITLAKGRMVVMRRLDEIGVDGLVVGERTRKLVNDLHKEWAVLDERIKAYNEEFAARPAPTPRRDACPPSRGLASSAQRLCRRR